MNHGFTKLFGSIVTSSIWVEDDKTLRVWIAMLASCNASGLVEGSVPGMANLCRLSVEEMQNALDKLCSPDPYSRTSDHDGRRLEPVPGGWKVLNYLAYREKGQDKPGSRAAYARQRRVAQNCNALQSTATCGTEAEAEAEAEKKKNNLLPTVVDLSPNGDAAAKPRKAKGRRGRVYDLPSMGMTEQDMDHFNRAWNIWPTEAWNYSLGTMQPRRRNREGTLARFAEILRMTNITGPTGERLSAGDLADVAQYFVETRRRQAETRGEPLNVPCIENFFSPVDGTKTPYWINAVSAWINAQRRGQ